MQILHRNKYRHLDRENTDQRKYVPDQILTVCLCAVCSGYLCAQLQRQNLTLTQLQFTAGLHQVCHTKEPGFVQFWLLGPRGTIISSPETLRRHCGITLEAKTHMVSILLCKLKQHCWPKYQLIFEDVKKKKKII